MSENSWNSMICSHNFEWSIISDSGYINSIGTEQSDF